MPDQSDEFNNNYRNPDPHPVDALMNVYWRCHADTLEEPHRTQLHHALDIFAETREPAGARWLRKRTGPKTVVSSNPQRSRIYSETTPHGPTPFPCRTTNAPPMILTVLAGPSVRVRQWEIRRALERPDDPKSGESGESGDIEDYREARRTPPRLRLLRAKVETCWVLPSAIQMGSTASSLDGWTPTGLPVAAPMCGLTTVLGER